MISESFPQAKRAEFGEFSEGSTKAKERGDFMRTYSVVVYDPTTDSRIRIPATTETEAFEICQLHAPYAYVERW